MTKSAKPKKSALTPPVDRVPDDQPARPATDAKNMLGVPTSPTPPAAGTVAPSPAAAPSPEPSTPPPVVEKSVHINVRPKTQKRLKVLAAKKGRGIIDLAEDAFKEYFDKHGYPEIDE